MIYPQDQNKEVVGKNADGTVYGRGKMVAYSGEPMVCVEMEDGRKFWWQARLCEVKPEAVP